VNSLNGTQSIEATAATSELTHLDGRGVPRVKMQDDCVPIRTRVRTYGSTGVEMEALTAASIAGLTLYGMLKALSKEMRLDGLRLLAKSGGRSGNYRAEE